MKKRIFVALSTFAEHGDQPRRLLHQSGFSYSANRLGRRLAEGEIIDLAKGADGIIAGVEPYTKNVLQSLPQLKCISRCGVGIDNIDLSQAKKQNIEIRNTPDVVIQPVAELTVAMAFDLLKKLTLHTQLIKSHRWEKHTGLMLQGRTVGVLGLGRIGKRVAEMMKALGADVFGADIKADKAWARKNKIKIVPTSDLLKKSDLLTIHLSHSDKNPFKLGVKEIQAMKKGAMVINVSRGEFVDEQALYDALKSGHLAGAGLDVYQKEPYAEELCELDDVVLTPHIATLTQESRLQMEIEATKNLVKYFKP